MSEVKRQERRSTDPEPSLSRQRSMERELAQLRQELQHVRSQGQEALTADLRSANEMLVLAAMEAEMVADSAFSQLEEVTRSSQIDALTGTPTRTAMRGRIDTAIGLARRHGSKLAVGFVDLDGFKQINDLYGHEHGDAMLSVAARRLESAVRDSDTVSRHGGDEFLLLFSEISQPTDAALIAHKVLDALSQPLNHSTVQLGGSLGLAIFPEDGDDAATLIEHADSAMYRAKRSGGRRFEFFGQPPLFESEPSPQRQRLSAQDNESLREANQNLMLAAVVSQESELASRELQRRHEKYVSMVAHELRAPMMPLRTCAELLSRAKGDEASIAKLEQMIKRQVDHLARIVDDLLEGSRVNGGKFKLQLRPVDALAVIDAAIESCNTAMVGRGQQIRRLGPTDVDLVVDGDPARLLQVFGNLIDNASKYSLRAGTITLTIASTDTHIAVKIADNGIGIEPHVLPQIFDLFVQDPRAVAVHGGGLGIGLAVVRDLVLAHGGSVQARSEGSGRGSEFEVILPRSTSTIGSTRD